MQIRPPTVALVLVLTLCTCAHATPAKKTTVLWFGGDVQLSVTGANTLAHLGLDGPLIVNLEGPITPTPRSSSPDGSTLFNPPSTARWLHQASVIAVGVENNHSGDDGDAGVSFTRAALEAERIAPLGASTIDGVRLLQVDLSWSVPSSLGQRLASFRPHVVLFHVLAPPLYLPEPSLRRAVDAAVASGARAVIAHGSHSMAGVERRGGTVIAWGLGNLAFACECTQERSGLLVRLEFEGGEIRHASVHPVFAGLDGQPAHRFDEASAQGELDVLESLGSHLTRRATSAEW